MKVFDLHLHPAFKNFLSNHYKEMVTEVDYDQATKPIEMQNALINFAEKFFDILESQSSFDQLIEGEVGTAVVGISNVEKGFADSKGIFGNLLKWEGGKILDTQYLIDIIDGEVSYVKMFIKEIEYYNQIVQKSKGKIRYVTRSPHQKEQTNDHKLDIVFSIEGGHNLSSNYIGKGSTEIIDVSSTSIFKGRIFNKKPEANLIELWSAMWENGADILYLTLTHLTYIYEQDLASHAFGLKLLDHSSFFPHGHGITESGKRVINAALTNSKEGKNYPILIDVKHMSLKSRLEYYEYLKENKYRTGDDYTYPIIASHVGITGYDLHTWKNALKLNELQMYHYESARCVQVGTKRKLCGKWGFTNKKFTFNPWTINLLDEDIVHIVNSDGLIGLSMDVRVLGFQAKIGMTMGDSCEYLSRSEFQYFFPQINLSQLDVKTKELIENDMESWMVPSKEERHPLCFCFNIIHIMVVGLAKSKYNTDWRNVAKSLCIGSDFDGLISPMKICDDASRYKELKSHLLQWLPVAAKAYQKEHGFGNHFYKYIKSQNIDEFTNGILFDNANKFIADKWMDVKDS